MTAWPLQQSDWSVHFPGWFCNNRSAHTWGGSAWVSKGDRIPTDPLLWMLCRLFFPSLLVWVGDPCRGFRPHAPGGRDFCSLDIPLAHYHTFVREPAFSGFLPFLPVSIWLLEILGYYILVQVALSWLSMLIVL